MIRITKDQAIALANRYFRAKMDKNGITYRAFRRTVQPTFGCDGAVAVQWQGMWLCIERDGYTHS
jgi:hypothetical protein